MECRVTWRYGRLWCSYGTITVLNITVSNVTVSHVPVSVLCCAVQDKEADPLPLSVHTLGREGEGKVGSPLVSMVPHCPVRQSVCGQIRSAVQAVQRERGSLRMCVSSTRGAGTAGLRL